MSSTEINRRPALSPDLLGKIRDELAANRAANYAGKEVSPQFLIPLGDEMEIADDLIINAESNSTFYITEFDQFRITDAFDTLLSGLEVFASGGGAFLTGVFFPDNTFPSQTKNMGDFMGGVGGFMIQSGLAGRAVAS